MRLLVDDLLDFARIQAGSFHLDCFPTDLAALIEMAVSSLEPQAKEREVTLQIQSTKKPFQLFLDPRRIEEVIMNLVGNALKYTGAGGRITVTLLASPDEARVEVQDTGIGIASKDQKHLFEAYYQVPSSQTRERGGAGLGLSISKTIVEAHGGAIGVKSEPGKGSTFWFTLPLEHPLKVTEPEEPPLV